MEVKKIIGRAIVGALALSAIPYRIKVDKETNTLELRSLLWGLRKTPGEDKDHYAFAIPASGLDEEADAEAEGSPEEPVPEAPADDV